METIVAVGTRPDRLPLGALLVANVVSLIGSALTAVALPWFVLQTTGSAARTGLVAAFVVLPAFLAGIFGGPLVDRLGAKRVSVLADLVGTVGIGLIPLLARTVGLPFWGLLLLVFLGALLEIPGLSARRAMLPELARAAGWRLERANGAFESIQHLSLLVGPPVAGVLIAWLGPSDVLWVDAASFAAAAGLVAAAVPDGRVGKCAAASGRYLGELVAGWRFLRGDRLLLTLAITLTIGNALTGSLVTVLLPVYAEAAFGRATALGAAVAAAGAGWLVGGLAFGAIGHRLPRRALWLVGFLVAPLDLWVLAAEPSLPMLVGTLALVGLIGGPINPLLVTVRHERIPPELRGRVFGAFSAIAMLAQPVGMFVAGTAIEGIGFRPTVLLLAAGSQALGIALLFVPTLRQMDTTRSPISCATSR